MFVILLDSYDLKIHQEPLILKSFHLGQGLASIGCNSFL